MLIRINHSFSCFFSALVVLALGGLLPAVAVAADEKAQPAAVPTPVIHPVATDVRLAGDGKTTRFVMELDRKIELRVFSLANPYRVIVDIPQVTFQLPPKAGEASRGMIKAFRYGLVMPGGSRIVMDLKRPAKIEKAYVVDAENGQKPKLIVELRQTDRSSFMQKLAESHSTADSIVTASISKPVVEKSEAEAAAPAAKPDDAGRAEARIVEAKVQEAKAQVSGAEAAKPSEDNRPVIVIDPGHGGIDNGTQADSGESEKNIVLDFARALRDRIEKGGKYRVVMTRDDDTFIPLAERVNIARNHKAALLLSIHADALPKGEGDAQGATVYTLSDTASDAEAAKLAEAENKADLIAGINFTEEPTDVADILIDLVHRETKAFSSRFARSLVREMKSVARLHKNPLKSAGFRVLKAPDVPSVLLELGYVSNKQDLQLLVNDKWRSRTVGSVAQAVDLFFGKRVVSAEPHKPKEER